MSDATFGPKEKIVTDIFFYFLSLLWSEGEIKYSCSKRGEKFFYFIGKFHFRLTD